MNTKLELVKSMLDEGLSMAEIGRRIGCTRAAIQGMKKRHFPDYRMHQNCSVCGKKLEGRTNRKTCSMECNVISRLKGPTTTTCVICGKVFEHYSGVRRKVCSQACRDIYRSRKADESGMRAYSMAKQHAKKITTERIREIIEDHENETFKSCIRLPKKHNIEAIKRAYQEILRERES